MIACITPETDPIEWEYMWSTLAHHHGDVADPCNDCGEQWEYLGTSVRAANAKTIFQHCMRHRHHPASGKREYVWIDASPGWKPSGLTLQSQGT